MKYMDTVSGKKFRVYFVKIRSYVSDQSALKDQQWAEFSKILQMNRLFCT
jgi:hypothetical protein